METHAPAPAPAGDGMAALVVPLYRCRLEQVGTRAAMPGALQQPADAAAFLRKLIPEGADRMYVVAIALDPRNDVLGAYEVAVGTLNSARSCRRASA